MERNSVMLSMAPKKAVLKARNRHELSSGIMRRTMVEACEGSGSSGASREAEADLRLRDKGLLVFGAEGGGAVPTSAREKEVGMFDVEDLPTLFEDVSLGLECAGFGSSLADEIGLLAADEILSLTISCSPSNVIPMFDSCAVSA